MSAEELGAPVLRVNMTRNELGVITAVDDNVVDLLGWLPEQLIGGSSTQFLHPQDQLSGVTAWLTMVTTPNSVGTWRGRYRTARGTWQWVETENRFDVERGVVSTTMTSVAVAQVSIEEELRARTELLTRLSDALPVGLFQIDTDRRVMFTNDRLHQIVGVAPAATIGAQLATVVTADRARLEAALAAVLAGEQADDIEIRLVDAAASLPHVCLVSLRALSDAVGEVSGAIGLVSDVTERVLLRQQLEIRATVDQLTSCLNRAAVLEVLERLVADGERGQRGIAVVYIDLDRFKEVNDRFGHAAGDRVLVTAADRLRSGIRAGDSIGRLGGDEFLVVCPQVDSADAAVDLAGRLRSVLHGSVDLDQATVELRASIGVAWTREPVDADTLITRSDTAMYISKGSRQSEVHLYVP